MSFKNDCYKLPTWQACTPNGGKEKIKPIWSHKNLNKVVKNKHKRGHFTDFHKNFDLRLPDSKKLQLRDLTLAKWHFFFWYTFYLNSKNIYSNEAQALGTYIIQA